MAVRPRPAPRGSSVCSMQCVQWTQQPGGEVSVRVVVVAGRSCGPLPKPGWGQTLSGEGLPSVWGGSDQASFSFQGPSACSGPGRYGGCGLSILGYVLRLPHLPELVLAAPILQMGNLRPRRCRSLSRATPDSSPQFMGPGQ